VCVVIAWKEEYMLGVSQIDEQHKKLFEIAERVFSLLKDKLQVDKYDKIVELIQELKEYTIYHFEFEEEYMSNIRYSKYFTHKKEHAAFIEKINNIDLTKVDEEQNAYLLEIMDYVVSWISNHILKRDKQIVSG